MKDTLISIGVCATVLTLWTVKCQTSATQSTAPVEYETLEPPEDPDLTLGLDPDLEKLDYSLKTLDENDPDAGKLRPRLYRYITWCNN